MSRHPFSVVGTRVPRKDSISKVTGSAVYHTDINFAGLLHAKILRSPVPHARILKIDTEDAEKMKGVAAVLTYRDCPSVRFNSSWRGAHSVAILKADQCIMEDKMRFVGDKVAAVAAETEGVAEDALKQIKVEFEELPAVFEPEEALRSEAPQIHEGGNLAAHREIKKGDVNQGFKEADYIFEDKYKTSRPQHATLETHGATAQFNPNTGRLNVWTPTQTVFGVRFALSKALEIPEGKIRVIQTSIGGAFGSKDEMFDEPLVALLSKKSGGKPVKIQYTREEEFVCARTRHPATLYLKTGIKKDGIFTARQLTAYFDTGAFTTAGPLIMSSAGQKFIAYYKCPNVQYDGYCVRTNSPVSGAFRGYGNPQPNFAVESQVDSIADELGIDALDLRLKNIVGLGDLGLGEAYKLESVALRECIVKGAELIGWREKRGRGQLRGVGMGQNTHSTSGKPAIPEKSSAILKANSDGTFTLLGGGSEMGQGLETILAQVVAEELTITPDRIEVIMGDTDANSHDLGSYASRSTHNAGNAVKGAAANMKEQLLEKAAAILKRNVDELEVENGEVYVREYPRQRLEYSEIVCESLFKPGGRTFVALATYEPPTNAPNFGAQFAEVVVDPETGKVNVLKIVSVHDSGKIINPTTAEGQVEGAVMQGMGYGLLENLVLDRGKVLNGNFKDYKIPTIADAPEIEVIFAESFEPTGPFGAKGLGEGCVVSVAPAIANALYDATKIRFHELPITSEMILSELKKKSKEEANSSIVS